MSNANPDEQEDVAQILQLPVPEFLRKARLGNSTTRVISLGDDSIVIQSLLCAGGSCESIPPMAVLRGHPDCVIHTGEATARPIFPGLC